MKVVLSILLRAVFDNQGPGSVAIIDDKKRQERGTIIIALKRTMEKCQDREVRPNCLG